ncbi:MAG: hypothetical protein WA958_13595 [Tunicatimonas sp.]
MKILAVLLLLLSVGGKAFTQSSRTFKGVAKTFYQQQIIPEEVYQTLVEEVRTGKIEDTQGLFGRMEQLSLQALPEDIRRYFPNDTANVYFGVGMMSQTPFFRGHKKLPKKYRTVVDYLLKKKVIDERCLALLEQYLFTPSDNRDAIIATQTLEHVFIQIFTNADACGT